MNTEIISNEEKGNGALADVMRCCDINCKEKAVFQVQDIGEGKTYEDYTHCCENHLAEMIGENTLHEVWRLKQ